MGEGDHSSRASEQTPGKAHDSVLLFSTIWSSNGVSDKQTQPRALPLLELPKLTSCCPWSIVKEHISCKSRAIAVEPLFPSVSDLQVGCFRQDSTEVRGCHYVRWGGGNHPLAAWLYYLTEVVEVKSGRSQCHLLENRRKTFSKEAAIEAINIDKYTCLDKGKQQIP